MTKQIALAVDAVLVMLFAAIGVLSHHEPFMHRWPIAVWPFLLALLVAWAVLLVRRRPVGTLASGVFVWLVTAWGGLAVRVAAGGGFAVSFAIVATVVTGVFLLGWRLAARKALVGI